jgi:hypothetical protein
MDMVLVCVCVKCNGELIPMTLTVWYRPCDSIPDICLAALGFSATHKMRIDYNQWQKSGMQSCFPNTRRKENSVSLTRV